MYREIIHVTSANVERPCIYYAAVYTPNFVPQLFSSAFDQMPRTQIARKHVLFGGLSRRGSGTRSIIRVHPYDSLFPFVLPLSTLVIRMKSCVQSLFN